jgi:hypothetical protein
MYHIVYLTTNLINNKIYVGKHSTYNLDDGYLGSGKSLKYSIKKHGEVNFKRQILHFCLTEDHAYELESQIVDQWFIDRKDTYNLISVCNSTISRLGATLESLYGIEKANTIKSKMSQPMELNGMYGTTHKVSTKIIMSAKAKNRTPNRLYKLLCTTPDNIKFSIIGLDVLASEYNLSKTILRENFNKGMIELKLNQLCQSEKARNTNNWCVELY